MVSTEVNDISSCKKAMKILVPVTELGKIRDQETAKVQKQAEIPGFRKGKAPLKRVISMFKEAIEKNTLESAMDYGFRQAITDKDIRPVGNPELHKIDFDDDKNLVMDMEVEVFPKIELKKYKNVKLEKTVYKIEDEDVEASIYQIRKRQAIVTPVEDGEAQDNHYLLVDMQELDDTGVPLVGKKYEDIRFQLGAGQFDAQIEKQLIGVKKGEEKFVEKQNQGSGKSERKVEYYNVMIKDIQHEELPEVDEEFVKSLNLGVETVSDFKDRIRTQLEYQWDQNSEERFYHQMAHELLQQTPFDVPDIMIDDYLDRIITEMRNKDKNLDEEAARKAYRTEAIFNIKWYYLKQRIAQAEDIKVGDEDYQSFLDTIEDDKMKKFYQENPQMRDRILQDLFEKKVFDFLVNNSSIKTIEEKVSKRKEFAGV
jgi:trigger factor